MEFAISVLFLFLFLFMVSLILWGGYDDRDEYASLSKKKITSAFLEFGAYESSEINKGNHNGVTLCRRFACGCH